MPNTDSRTLEELDRLELGPDISWDDLWLTGGDLVADTAGWWWAP
jgi:hypothetical protein